MFCSKVTLDISSNILHRTVQWMYESRYVFNVSIHHCSGVARDSGMGGSGAPSQLCQRTAVSWFIAWYLDIYLCCTLQILLGQKYGFRPYPPRINSDEFEKIRNELVLNNVSTSLLDAWFKKNTNVMPNIYILQPISSLLPHYADQVRGTSLMLRFFFSTSLISSIQGSQKNLPVFECCVEAVLHWLFSFYVVLCVCVVSCMWIVLRLWYIAWQIYLDTFPFLYQ